MNAASPRAGLFVSLRGLLTTAVALLQTRFELFVTELEEEKLRLLSLLAYAVAAFFFLGCGIVMLAIFFIVLFWDSNRLLAIGSFTAIFLFCGIAAVFQAQRLIRRKSGMFAASLAELAQDRTALHGESNDASGN